jgi:transposase
MAAKPRSKQRALRRSWSPAEKRRIVELTLLEGASLAAIAREHGVHPNNLYQWKALHWAGKLDASRKPASRVAGRNANATFVPVSVIPELRGLQPAARTYATAARSSVMQLVLASGATLRIETGEIDAALVCALVAELQG